MSHSTSLLDLVAQSQASKEVTVNAALDAASPAMIFGRRASASSGLTWGYYGGTMLVDGALTAIANGTLTLAASQTIYVQATRAGVVSSNTTGYSAGQIPLYTVVTGASSVTSYTDHRSWVEPRHLTSRATITLTASDVTLTAAEARCRHLTITGALTNNRSVIVPNDWEGVVFCNNTGAYTTTIKTAAGAGIVVAQTKHAILLADGVNVVRVTADA
jgi:hypothetical protein